MSLLGYSRTGLKAAGRSRWRTTPGSPVARQSRRRVPDAGDAFGNRESMSEADRVQRGPAKKTPTEKSFDIVLVDTLARLDEIVCADAGFTARLAPTSNARRWRAMVAPIDTGKIRQAVVRLTAVIGGQPRVFVLHAAVK